MLPKTYSRKEIPAKQGQIPRPETVKEWPHLKRIEEHLLPYQHDAYVGLLIGANCTKAIKPREVIPGADDDPYAVRTTLGWGVIGVINQSTIDSQENSHCSCNRIVSREIEDSLVKTVSHVVAKTSAKELFVPAQVNRMFERDFSEVSKEEKTLSFLDRRFLNTLESNTQRLSDGHYEIPLPLKEEGLKLPNNRNLALSRLHRLKHRLKKDSKCEYRKNRKSNKDFSCELKTPVTNIAKITKLKGEEGGEQWISVRFRLTAVASTLIYPGSIKFFHGDLR